MSYSVAISVFSGGGWRKGRGGCVRTIGQEHDFCQAQKAENTDPRTNYAVKYATARGHLPCPSFPWLFCFHQGQPQIDQRFSLPAEQAKTLEKPGKAPK